MYLEDFLPETYDPALDDVAPYLQAAIDATPPGGKLRLWRDERLTNIIIRQTIIINKSLSLDFGRLSSGVVICDADITAFIVASPAGIDMLEMTGFNLVRFGNSTCPGILIDGTMGTTPINGIWNVHIHDLWVQGFKRGIELRNVILPIVERVRVATVASIAFVVSGFSTGVKFLDCYADRAGGAGFVLTDANYPIIDRCHVDSAQVGFAFRTCKGAVLQNCSTEYPSKYAAESIQSTLRASNLTALGAGSQVNAWWPTIYYVSGGYAEISGTIEYAEAPSGARQYSIIADSGAVAKARRGTERLPYYGTQPLA